MVEGEASINTYTNGEGQTRQALSIIQREWFAFLDMSHHEVTDSNPGSIEVLKRPHRTEEGGNQH